MAKANGRESRPRNGDVTERMALRTRFVNPLEVVGARTISVPDPQLRASGRRSTVLNLYRFT